MITFGDLTAAKNIYGPKVISFGYMYRKVMIRLLKRPRLKDSDTLH